MSKSTAVFYIKLTQILVFGSICAGFCAWYVVFKISADLPDSDALINYNPDKATYIYDASGDLMGEIANEKRIFIPIEEIPPKVKNAFIAAEDKSFYQNSGIDLVGLAKAMLRNIIITIRDPGSRYQGGSTITQQVVRNILLSKERTAIRKAKEMILAHSITSRLSKDKILEIYLNHIYLGSRTYGVAAASKEYFNKDVSSLTTEEAALLASLPKAPSALDPTKNPQRAIVRRNYVLRQMLSEKYITQEEYRHAEQQEIVVAKKEKPRHSGDAFIDYVRYLLYQNGVTEEQLATGGYKINTTMRPRWQSFAQEALDKGVIRFDRSVSGYVGPITKIENLDKDWLAQLKDVPVPLKINKYTMAVVLGFDHKSAVLGCIDGKKRKLDAAGSAWAIPSIMATKPETPEREKAIESYDLRELFSVGDVIVISHDSKSSRLEQVPEADGAVVVLSPQTGDLYAMVGGYADLRATFNRSFQAKRQPGSAAKLFTYLAALNRGISPAEIFMDSEISYNTGDGTVWTPRNWTRSYRGPVTMRTGFEKSINTVTIRIAEKIGLRPIVNLMYQLGLTKEQIEPNLGICLGTGSTTLLDLTRAFAIVGNYGKKIEIKAISSIEADKRIVYLKSLDNEQLGQIVEEEQGESGEEEEEDLTPKETNGEQIVSEQVAYQMISLLLGAVERGTGGALRSVGMPIAAKTGTSQNGQSLWAIGLTPDVVIGVYIGHDIPKDKDNKVFAAGYAMPVLAEILERIKPEISKARFRIPEGIKMVKINKTTGLRTNQPVGENVIYEAFKDKDRSPEEENNGEQQQEIKSGTFDGIY